MDLIVTAIKAYNYRKHVNKTVRELNSLSDHALEDIGVARGEIKSIARASAEAHRTAWNK